MTARAITSELVEWIRAVCGDMPVQVCPLSSAVLDKDSITIRLLSATPLPWTGLGRSGRLLALDYLVAVEVSDPYVAHDMLAELVFAVSVQGTFEISDALGFEVGARLGLSSAASFVLRARLARETAPQHAAIVRFPLIASVEPR